MRPNYHNLVVILVVDPTPSRPSNPRDPEEKMEQLEVALERV
jgi:hypothetical protein